MKQHDKFIDFLHNLETRTGEHSLFEAVRKGYNAIFESEQEHPTMVFVVKFDNAEQASEEEYFLRDGWGSECNSVVDGDTVYVEATPKLAKILPSWFDGKDLTLKEAPASIAKKLHGDYLGEAVGEPVEEPTTYKYMIVSPLSRADELTQYGNALERKLLSWAKDVGVKIENVRQNTDSDDYCVDMFIIDTYSKYYDAIAKFLEDAKKDAPRWVSYGIRGLFERK